MGWGGLTRDDQKHWICGFSSSVVGGNAFISMVNALDDSLSLAWNRGYMHVVYEVDRAELIDSPLEFN